MGAIMFGEKLLPGRYAVAVLTIALGVTGCHTGLFAQESGNYKTLAQPGHFRINQADNAVMIYIPAEESLFEEDERNDSAAHRRLSWSFEKQKFVIQKHPGSSLRKKGFWIYSAPVTVAQYSRFCLATGREMPPEPIYGWISTNPITKVTFKDASDYCAWAGGHLPSLANWDIAVRMYKRELRGQSPVIFVTGGVIPTQTVGTLPGPISWNDEYPYTQPRRVKLKDISKITTLLSPFFTSDNIEFYNTGAKISEWCTDWFITYHYPKLLIYDPRRLKNKTCNIFTKSVLDATPMVTRIARLLTYGTAKDSNERGFRCVVEASY